MITADDLKKCHWKAPLYLDFGRGSWEQHRTCQEHPRFKRHDGQKSRKHPALRVLSVDGLVVNNLTEAAAALNRTEQENHAMAKAHAEQAEQQAAMPLEGGAGEKKWSLADGIAECKRELHMRQRVYPNLIARKQLTEEDAEKQSKALFGTLTFLEFCLRNEAKLRQLLKKPATEEAA